MDFEKKHILKSYKNEQDALDAIEKVKSDTENQKVSSVSGYNVEKPGSTEKFPINAFSPGELDMGEPAFKDYADDPSDAPDLDNNKKKDLDRTQDDRGVNSRMR